MASENVFQLELLPFRFYADIRFQDPPMEPQCYPLLVETLIEREYRVFPDTLENDDHIFFHATAAENLQSILEEGLRPGVEVGKTTLTTISYAPNSMIALDHWDKKRADRQEGVILALRFETLEELFLSEGTHYSRALKIQPVVIGKCSVPSTYDHR
jgi:hypothetical protein